MLRELPYVPKFEFVHVGIPVTMRAARILLTGEDVGSQLVKNRDITQNARKRRTEGAQFRSGPQGMNSKILPVSISGTFLLHAQLKVLS